MIHIIKSRQNLVKLLSLLVVLFLMLLNYFNSFVPRYDVGNNLDDKTTFLLSSEYSILSIDKHTKALENILLQCNTESSNSKLCIERYSYRGNTLGNYLLPGILINIMINPDSNNFNESLSIAFFQGLSALLLLVFSYILFVMFKMDYLGSIFALISFIVLTLANPYLAAINFSKISSIFFL